MFLDDKENIEMTLEEYEQYCMEYNEYLDAQEMSLQELDEMIEVLNESDRKKS